MTLSIQDYANAAPQSNRIAEIGNYVKEDEEERPIDRYILKSRKIILYGSEENLQSMPDLGRLLLIGLVSEAESFFRSILSSCLEICPVCQKTAGEKQINLGGVLWHGKSGFSKSAFEHMSFASKEDIKKAAKQFLNIDLTDDLFKSPLEEFEKVCQLRHGIVHNAGFVPGRNAVQLGIRKYTKPAIIEVDFACLQEAAAVVDTLVITLNRELFSAMCKRWAVDWRNSREWKDAGDTEFAKLFAKIWKVFNSDVERKNRQDKKHLTQKKCMEKIKDDFRLND